MRSIVWFRGKDLRVADHAPLLEAVAGGEVLPLFVLDPYFFAPQRARQLPHRMQFLLESLESLAANLAHLGSRLLLAEGPSPGVVSGLAHAWKADQVLAHRWTEPFGQERDRQVKAMLGATPLRLFEGETLLAPGSVRNGQGEMFKVYTPFSKACFALVPAQKPLPAPRSLPPVPADVTLPPAAIPTLASLGIARNDKLQRGGEKAARERLKAFLPRLALYYKARDHLDEEGTSRLSADLKFGTLSVRSVWSAASEGPPGEGRERYLKELLWREFTHHLLHAFPALLKEPFRPDFKGFPYLEPGATWEAWTAGRTGYPVVDAAARELRETGYVHNRARMITASFLTKHLLHSYRLGEAHYMTWLTDGDWAQNNAGWQWSAGCGCDAQPYFRVFNPVSQGQSHDPSGAYVRRWLPELAQLPGEHLHAPWEAPALLRRKLDYPAPVVPLAEGRDRFLAAARAHLRRETP